MNNIEYLLICLIEEASEVQKAAAKALRFGLNNFNPDTPYITNVEELRNEVTDFQGISDLLEEEGILMGYDWLGVSAKKERVKRGMDTSMELGVLNTDE